MFYATACINEHLQLVMKGKDTSKVDKIIQQKIAGVRSV